MAGYLLFSKFHYDYDSFNEQFEKVTQVAYNIVRLSKEEKATLQGEDKIINLYFDLCEKYLNGYCLGERSNKEKSEFQRLWLTLPIKDYGEDIFKRDFFLFLHISNEGMVSEFLKSQIPESGDIPQHTINTSKDLVEINLLVRSKVLKFFNSSFNESAFLGDIKLYDEKERLKDFLMRLLMDIKKERMTFFPFTRMKELLYKKLSSLSLTDIEIICDLD